MEFALVLPLVLVTLLAVIEGVVVARTQLQLTAAVREGAREAATNPEPARAVAAVRAALGVGADEVRVSVRRPHRVGAVARVDATLPVRIAAPLFGGFTVHLQASAGMRVER